jgi:hypothetical protein
MDPVQVMAPLSLVYWVAKCDKVANKHRQIKEEKREKKHLGKNEQIKKLSRCCVASCKSKIKLNYLQLKQ